MRAGAMARQGSSAGAIVKEVDAIMRKWRDDVKRPLTSSISDIYTLARIAGHKKATKQSKASLQYNAKLLDVVNVDTQKADVKLEPDFGVVDDAAVAALQREGMIWVGGLYDKRLRDVVRSVVREVMEAGLDRKAAGVLMAAAIHDTLRHISIPTGFKGPDRQYFEGLAANTATNARVRGQMQSFIEIGITRYELVNPMDHRTSEICEHMNGKVFYVSDGAKQMAADMAAKTPAALKEAHPWLTIDEIKAISSKAGDVGRADAAALSEAGLALPPFHFRCRTVVDISVSAGSYADLAA
jgi:hypothetical protein